MTFPVPRGYREALQSAGDKVDRGLPAGAPRAERPAGPGTATMQGTADVVEYLGNEELLHVTVDGNEVVAIVDSSNRVRPGDVVQLGSRPTSCTCSPPRPACRSPGCREVAAA